MSGTEQAPDARTPNGSVSPRLRQRVESALSEPTPVHYRHGSTERDEPSVRNARLVVVSNRLPVTLQAAGDGGWDARPASGGLVTALETVMDRRGGLWVGWPGTPDAGHRELSEGLTRMWKRFPYQLHPVSVAPEEREGFYHGYSNRTLWPVLHGFQERCEEVPEAWEQYRKVNRRFAEVLATLLQEGDRVWIHDYHLFLVGRELRQLGVDNRVGFFLHTPFPRPETLEAALPQAATLVNALRYFDLVGFQTPRDEDNFRQGLARFEGPNGHPSTAPGTGSFPTPIDYRTLAQASQDPAVRNRAREIRDRLGHRTLLLGVDRLDYTKGIPERLHGLDRALESYPELRGQVVLRQLVIPSREAMQPYQEQKAAIEALVDAVNRRWGRPDWTPVRYRYGTWDRTELLAHYRAADAALVTPVKDGMNLVSKEYCAANPGDGILILSAFAGAAGELGGGALLVDPADPQGIAAAIRHAHQMPSQERMERMRTLKSAVRGRPIEGWVDAFLDRTG